MTTLRPLLTMLCTAAALALAAAAPAQSPPPIINYQGRLVNAEGTPLTGPQALSFAIYDAATGGNLVWGPQTFPAVPLVDGNYNVLLSNEDAGAGGSSVTTAFTGSGTAERYFAVFVGGVQNGPRQRVVSVPWAWNIPDGSVSSSKIAPDAVDSSKIPNGSILGSDMAPGIVGGRELAPPVVATVRLGSNSSTSTSTYSPVLSVNMEGLVQGRPLHVGLSHEGESALRLDYVAGGTAIRYAEGAAELVVVYDNGVTVRSRHNQSGLAEGPGGTVKFSMSTVQNLFVVPSGAASATISLQVRTLTPGSFNYIVPANTDLMAVQF